MDRYLSPEPESEMSSSTFRDYHWVQGHPSRRKRETHVGFTFKFIALFTVPHTRPAARSTYSASAVTHSFMRAFPAPPQSTSEIDPNLVLISIFGDTL